MKNTKKLISILLLSIVGLFFFTNTSLSQQTAGQLFEKALYIEEAKGELQQAIDLYQQILKQYPENREAGAKAQLHIGLCYEKLGLNQAQRAYQKVIDSYPEQTDAVKTAQKKLSLLLTARDVVEKRSTEFRTRQVWTGSEVDGSGKISPDGKYLSFVDWNTGNLAVREMATGKKILLTKKGSWKMDETEFAMESVWSHDGKQLAYVWENDAKKCVELHVVGLDDRKSRILYQVDFKKNWVQPLDWSTEDKYVLAFFTEQKHCNLGLISVKDGSIRIIKTFPAIDPFPMAAHFSPDGRYIVYEFPQDELTREKDISIISSDGKNELPLITHPANDNLLGWSPDGNWILFASDRTGTWDAWVIQIAEGKPQKNPQLVRWGIGSINSLGFSQDGSFYYSFAGGMYDVFSAKIDPETGRVLESPKKVPLPYEGHNINPDWSPDGKHIAYTSMRGPRNRQRVLCIFSMESGSVRELNLKEKFAYFGYPRWCPDGRHIMLGADHVQSGKGLYKVDAQTDEVTVLIQAKENESMGSFWSPVMAQDGKSIYYIHEKEMDGYYRVIERDLETGKEEVLLNTPANDNNMLALSPDGNRLALLLREEKDMRMLKVMPTKGGEPVELHRFELRGRDIVDIDWSPDGRYIYFSKHTSEGWELWRVPVLGGEAENLKLIMSRFRHLNIHPDGRRITFASRVDQILQEIWVMENFLPE